MDCYFCQRQRVTMSAVAICQGCGAGCCSEHVEERVHPGRGPGLQTIQAPRIELLCQRCLALQAPLLVRAHRQAKTARNAPCGVKEAPLPALPDAQVVISAAEDLLRLDSRQASKQDVSGGWRRFFRWLRSR